MNAAAGLTPRAMAIAASECCRIAVVAGVAAGRQDEQLLEVDPRPVHVGFADEALAERGVAQHLHLATVDRGAQFLPRRRTVERRPRLQPEQHTHAASRRLRPHDRRPTRSRPWRSRRPPRTSPGRRFGLGEPEADRAAALPADLAEQRDLRAGVVEAIVVALTEPHRPFEHSRAVTAEHLGERQQFVGGGVGARHGTSVGHTVQERAARRHAERPRRHRLVEQARHGDHVVARRRRLVESALAHHVGPQRTVADEPAGVRSLGQPVDRVVVLAVRLPVPRQRIEDRLGGDVLDALHHLRQRGPVVGPARRERHPAVAHHHARHAVPAARRADRIPRDLGVEVGVDVDEARA